MKFLLVVSSIALLLNLKRVKGAAGDGANIAAFNNLCTLYRLAVQAGEYKVEFPQRERIKLAHREIERLFIVTMSDQDFENGVFGPLNSEEDKGRRKEEWQDRLKGWIGDQVEVDGVGVPKYVRPRDRVTREAIHEKLKLIKNKADSISRELDKLGTNANKSIADIKTAALDAAYGASQKKVDEHGQGTFTDTYATACGGNAGHNDGPGKSLISDMVCLCIGASGGSGAGACGPERFSVALGAQSYTSTGTGLATWNILKGHCEASPEGGVEPVQANEIGTALTAFRILVGARHENTATVDFILGNPKANGCDGSTDAQRNCVNYKNQFTGKKGKFDGVHWYQNLEKVKDGIQKVQGIVARFNLLESKMETLETVAWSVYTEKGNHPSEPTGKLETPKSTSAETSTPTGKATAQEPSTVNAAIIPSFILPWTLII